MRGAAVAGVGLLTGWGEGVAALPADAGAAAGGRRVLALAPPALAGERFRRATRECLLGVLAVEALLRDAGLAREDLRGSETALVYATAGAYGRANLEFIGAGTARPVHSAGGLSEERGGGVPPGRDSVREPRAGALHFPYTAPSAVPGEVTIEFGLTGPYSILIGGATATLDALWQAARLVARGQCRQALVLAVETFAGCEALWRRGRWLLRPPLVEAAACALLVPGDSAVVLGPAAAPAELETLARARAGETLACAPLVALALGRAAGRTGPVALTGQWRDRHAGLALEAH